MGWGSGIFPLLIIVASGGFTGLFVYSPTPGKGNLIASITAANGTDPYGNLFYQGFATYVPSGGNSLVLNLLSSAPATAGFFQYNTPSGGVQGGRILSVVAASGTDPVTGTPFLVGMTGIDPAFADTIQTVGANITLLQVAYSQSATIQAFTAATSAVNPGLRLNAPEQTNAGHLQMVMEGSSPDGTKPGQLLLGDVNGAAVLTPATLALLELQGGSALLNLAANPASVASDSQLWSDAFTQLHTDRAFVTQVDVETANHAAPGAGGSGPKWYGASGYGLYQSGQTGIGGDTNSYDTGRLTLFTTSTQTISTTTASTITGLSKALGIGTYEVDGSITYLSNQVDAANHPTIGFSNGATVTQGYYNGEYTVRTNNVTATSPITAFNNTNFDAIGTSHTGPAYVNGQFVEFTFRATITVSVAGTLTVVAKTSLVADTFTIQAGSYIHIRPVVAS